tara:strand:- start:7077 stop:7241 length:165 start_codon:yes stop_codon:yes gene_type:complete
MMLNFKNFKKFAFDNYDDDYVNDIKKGIDKINFSEYGFKVKGQLGYSLLVKKIN